MGDQQDWTIKIRTKEWEVVKVLPNSDHPLSKYVYGDDEVFVIDKESGDFWPACDFFYSNGLDFFFTFQMDENQ